MSSALKKQQIDIKDALHNDPDFINCPRFNNSLKNLINHNPDGLTDKRIAQYLMISEEEVVKTYQNIIEKIRQSLKLK